MCGNGVVGDGSDVMVVGYGVVAASEGVGMLAMARATMTAGNRLGSGSQGGRSGLQGLGLYRRMEGTRAIDSTVWEVRYG